jgi:hypothetical protein
MESRKRKSKKDEQESEQNIGFQFNAPVTAEQQTFVQGDVNNLNVNRGLSKAELEQLDGLFQPFKEQLQEVTPQDKQNQVEEKAQELHTELSKGQNASAERLNKIVDGLVELVPAAVSSVVSMFATPLLGGLVGPATKLVLDHIRK